MVDMHGEHGLEEQGAGAAGGASAAGQMTTRREKLRRALERLARVAKAGEKQNG